MNELETGNMGPRRHPSLDWTQREIGCPGVVFSDAAYDRSIDFRGEDLVGTGSHDRDDDNDNENRNLAALLSSSTEDDAIN